MGGEYCMPMYGDVHVPVNYSRWHAARTLDYTVPDIEIFELLWIKVVNLSGHIQYVLHSVEKYTQ